MHLQLYLIYLCFDSHITCKNVKISVYTDCKTLVNHMNERYISRPVIVLENLDPNEGRGACHNSRLIFDDHIRQVDKSKGKNLNPNQSTGGCFIKHSHHFIIVIVSVISRRVVHI